MPFSADPQATTRFAFTTSIGRQVRLTLRFITTAEATAHRAAVAKIARDFPNDRDAVREALKIGLIGPTCDELESQMSADDLRRLAHVWIDAVSVTVPDLTRIFVAANYTCGQVCTGCTSGQCDNEPSERRPAMLDCPVCENTKAAKTCETCSRRGSVRITTCYQAFAGADVWDLVRLSRFAESVALPVAGGVLNQTESFMSFLAAYRSAVAQIKAKTHAE